MKSRTWTDTQLVAAVAASTSVAGVLRELRLSPAGGSQAFITSQIQALGLDTSHFRGQAWNRGSKAATERQLATLQLRLVKGSRKITRLQQRLIATGLKAARCEECGITEWQGQPAPLQVDHVDGDRLNNELGNLRMLCANCHMLTDTWGFKGGRRRTRWVLEANVSLPKTTFQATGTVTPPSPDGGIR